MQKTIKEKGGTQDVYAQSTEAISEELFDMGTKELYTATGGTRHQRHTLPKEAQKAFIVGETVANHDLKVKDIKGSQNQKNEQIVDSVRESGQKARKLFPW
ncbi:MAG TPA: hypothetical protein DCL61_08690 [Cyanobacteria bacterium UBA12227]|nr:hypothetical protein [Cyanobacteria bacterium UBA12227]HAX88181.1 hypothetical protein [Cyanobacteria bacterium UBA11370]HBY80647.1 hypothetical protein [Cyanobacteria bacterium UBA11148]